MTARRNEFAKEVGVEIRSFDSLLDRLRDLGFQNLVMEGCSESWVDDIVTRNRLANPFLRAYSWGAWKHLVLKGDFVCGHFLAGNAPALLSHRSENADLKRFRAIWNGLADAERKSCLMRLLDSYEYP